MSQDAPFPMRRRDVLAGLVGTGALGLAPPVRAQSRVPFQTHSGKIFAPVRINGTPVEAILDSGASASGIDRAFAAQLGVRGGRRFRINGLQGSAGGAWAEGVSVSVAGRSIPEPRVGVLDLSGFARAFQRPVEAVLGRDLFDRFVVEVDHLGKTMALHDRQDFTPPAGARLVRLTAIRDLMTAPVTIEGSLPFQAVVDLGNDSPLILSPGPARALRLLDGRPSSTVAMGGYGELSAGRIVTARTLGLAGTDFRDVPIQIASRSIGFDANLGLPILSRFHNWFDFGGARMFLAPTLGPAAFFHKDRTGMNGYIENGRLKIIHVARGGPAEAGGWRAGDQVIAIDGQPPERANYSLSDEAGRTVEFTMADGTKRRLVLADYY